MPHEHASRLTVKHDAVQLVAGSLRVPSADLQQAVPCCWSRDMASAYRRRSLDGIDVKHDA